MKRLLIVLYIFVVGIACTQCMQENPHYELTAQLDDQLAEKAQKTMAHIESTDIEIRATELPVLEFGSAYVEINAEENWIKPYYAFVPEDMSAYRKAPESINGVILAKFKSKDKIDLDFGLSNSEKQGICADVQQEMYDSVLALLTEEERERYETKGKSLSFIPDDDWPPLDTTTNPVNQGSAWLDVDPAGKITRDGDQYYYEPISLYVEFDDPAFQDIDDKYRGVRYCKFLSHQALLSWMLEKSFEEDPVLITATVPECDQPSSVESKAGSCIFYFTHSQTYYCSDYTGSGFTYESAEAKCDSRPSSPKLSPLYSTLPCSGRTEEIESIIPDYQGLTGLCVIHCQTPEEFIWNIYTENPEESCGDFDFFYPEEIEEMNPSQ